MPNATFTPGKLTDDLVPVIDEIRGLFSELGARSSRVFVVRRTWTGERPGEGAVSEVATEILPAPAVLVRGLRGDLRPAGVGEEGDIVLSEVSLTWTEPELFSPDLQERERLYYRVQDAHGQEVRSRYYVPIAPPQAVRGDADRADVLGWTIELKRVSAGDLG